MNKFINYLITLIFIIIVIILIYEIKNYNYKNTFLNQKHVNAANDGNMKFDYLNEPNYSKNILDKYYLNVDKKINGVNVCKFFFQKKFPNGDKSIYGNVLNHLEIPGSWGNYSTFSDYMYNTYGVRR